MPRNLLSVQAFESSGLLPPGEYSATCAELRESLLVRGPGVGTDWDAAWRLWLVDNVEILARQLWSVGIQDVFLDGSFVEDKSHPNDIDGYFVCDLQELASGRLQDALNRLDPHSVWTWNPNARRACRGYPKMQLPMWHQYRVELYPHYGQGSGVRDDFGHEFEFPSLFRQNRATGQPKGIVHLRQERSPL